MNASVRRVYVVAALVATVGAVLAVSLMQPIVGAQADFSIYNGDWNGASQLARDAYGTGSLQPAVSFTFGGSQPQVTHLSFTDVDLHPARGSLLLLGPSDPPTPAEQAWLARFVEGGGRLVVADDFGPGDAFLDASGAQTRLLEGQLASLAFAKQPPFLVTRNLTEAAPTAGVSEIVLDYAAGLEPGDNATVLASTSQSAWIDTDQDGQPDPGEATGPFPLVAHERVGQGEVLVVSDPSLLINGMRSFADNERFAENLVAWLTEDDRKLVIDEAHHGYANPVRFLGTRLAEVPPAWRTGLGLAAAGAFLLVAVGRPERWARQAIERIRGVAQDLLPPPPKPEHDPVERVLERHPAWNKSTLQRLLVAWEEEHGARGDREAP